jgi:hypothetical protein
MMMSWKKIIACGALLAVLFVSACGDYPISDSNRFDSKLRGTWIQNEPGYYIGELEIGFDWIIITGFNEYQTPWGRNDDERPFKGFTKKVRLNGYSEEGCIYIEDIGEWQEGIPYTYWESASLPPKFTRDKLLTFTFGGRKETFRKEE